MKKRQILLSEAEFFNLIKRIVKEAKEEEMDMDMGDDSTINGFRRQPDMDIDMDMEGSENEISKTEAIDLIAKFFKQEVLPELSPAEKNNIKRKLGESRVNRRSIREDDEMSKDDRRSDFREKLMMRGGGLMTGAGILGVIGRSMGWSEFETTSKIYEFIEQFGAGEYSGPITVAMIVAGLTMAFKGRADKYKRTGM